MLTLHLLLIKYYYFYVSSYSIRIRISFHLSPNLIIVLLSSPPIQLFYPFTSLPHLFLSSLSYHPSSFDLSLLYLSTLPFYSQSQLAISIAIPLPVSIPFQSLPYSTLSIPTLLLINFSYTCSLS